MQATEPGLMNRRKDLRSYFMNEKKRSTFYKSEKGTRVHK